MSRDPVRFGSFVYDPASNLVLRGTEPLDLGRRAVSLLGALLDRRGKVVSKADLLDAAWPGDAVEESNLSVQIAKLRKRIGSNWIRTVERVGYQFVELGRADQFQSLRQSISVSPVVAFGGDQALARILSDELIDALIPFGALTVLKSGPDLPQARYGLECNLRHKGGDILIAARLLDTDSGAYCWFEHFGVAHSGKAIDRIVDHLTSSLEAAIAQIKTNAVAIAEPDVTDVGALYWRAQAYLRTSRPDDYARAAALLDLALGREPDNVACLAAMCEALHHRISMGWPPIGDDDAERCRAFALHGLDQPNLDARSLSLFGTAIYRTFDQDWGFALMQRAARLNPRDLTAMIYAATANMHWGRIQDAEEHYRRALRLNPQSPSQGFVMGGLARIRMIEGKFEDALAWANRSRHMNANYGATHWTLVSASSHLGRAAESERYLERFRALQSGVTVESIRRGQPTRGTRMASTLEGLEAAGLVSGSTARSEASRSVSS